MKTEKNNMGYIIKKLRKFKGKTQAQLSEDTGFSQNTISNHENNNRGIGLNEMTIYGKALGVSQYIMFKIFEEYEKEGHSRTIENFEAFSKLYSYVNKAYYSESDIYYYSDDRYEETVTIMNTLKEANINIDNISYEYVLDIYKQILSNPKVNKSGSLPDGKSLKKEQEETYNALISFNHSFFELTMKKYHTDEEIKNAIEKAFELEKESLDLAEKLKIAPNYTYDYIKGEPMYIIYEKKYPERLREFREYLSEQVD